MSAVSAWRAKGEEQEEEGGEREGRNRHGDWKVCLKASGMEVLYSKIIIIIIITITIITTQVMIVHASR